jgi:hypothetical protein
MHRNEKIPRWISLVFSMERCWGTWENQKVISKRNVSETNLVLPRIPAALYRENQGLSLRNFSLAVITF